MEGSMSRAEPSTLKPEIVEGSLLRPEPSTKTPRIMEGSISSAEPSTLKPEIVEGSIPQTHSADPSSSPVPQARTPPLSDPVPSIQYAGWHGTYY